MEEFPRRGTHGRSVAAKRRFRSRAETLPQPIRWWRSRDSCLTNSVRIAVDPCKVGPRLQRRAAALDRSRHRLTKDDRRRQHRVITAGNGSDGVHIVRFGPATPCATANLQNRSREVSEPRAKVLHDTRGDLNPRARALYGTGEDLNPRARALHGPREDLNPRASALHGTREDLWPRARAVRGQLRRSDGGRRCAESGGSTERRRRVWNPAYVLRRWRTCRRLLRRDPFREFYHRTVRRGKGR